MRQLFWFIIIAALAVAAAMFLRQDAGYVVVVTPPYRIEVSLTLAVAGIVVAFLVLYGLLRLVSHTLRMPAQVSQLRKRWRQNRGREALRGAMQTLLEGRYAKSQKLARRAYELDEAPALAALTGARAAHQMRDKEERERWLERAAGAAGDSIEARLATRAELLLDERRFEEARAVLRELDAKGPKQIATMRLLMRAEQGLQHWDEVLRIVRLLEKRGALAPETAESLRITATVETLKRKAVDIETLQAFWSDLPTAERREPRVAATAARQFLALGGCKQAHRVLTDVISREWVPELVLLFAECHDEDALQRIEQAEKWLKERPHDASLLLALGKLCAYQELWGKAQSYLEASLSQTASRATHLELARLFDRIGRESDANLHYRAATDSSLPA
jgi:HemY protein